MTANILNVYLISFTYLDYGTKRSLALQFRLGGTFLARKNYTRTLSSTLIYSRVDSWQGGDENRSNLFFFKQPFSRLPNFLKDPTMNPIVIKAILCFRVSCYIAQCLFCAFRTSST